MNAPAVLLLALFAQTESLVKAPDTSRSDLAERLIVRFDISFDPVFGALSEGDDNGQRLGSMFLNGTLAAGSRGLGLPMLNSYVLGQGMMDLAGAPTVAYAEDPNAERPVHPSVFHQFGDSRALLLQLAYAELEGFTTKGALSNFHLRAGRQFHWGPIAVTFDGATLGYDSKRFAVSVRGGQRSGVYDRAGSDPQREAANKGFFGAVNARYTYHGGGGFRLGIEADYLHYERRIGLLARDIVVTGGEAAPKVKTDLAELEIELAPMRTLSISARGQFVNPELSKLQLDLQWELGTTVLMLDFTQKIGRSLFYDLAGGSGVVLRDRESTYESFRLNIPDARPYSDIRVTALIAVTDWLDLEPMAGARLVSADDAERTAYDASRVSWGLLGAANFEVGRRAGVEVSGEYLGFLYLRDPDIDGGSFVDFATGGETFVHDVSASVRYVRRGDNTRGPTAGRLLTGRTLSAGIFGHMTLAVLDNRFLDEAVAEGTYGVGIDARWNFSRYAGVSLAYELASDSNIFLDEFGAFHALRVGLQGRF